MLLDLSAAFDTVDHEIMLEILKSRFGVNDSALGWIKSFLSDIESNLFLLTKYFLVVSLYDHWSSAGKLLGTDFASFLCVKMFEIIQKHLPSSHGYADDTQLYLSFRPETPVCQSEAVRIVETYITDIRTWLISQKLKFNDLKTEFLIIGTRQQLKKIEINSVRVGDVDIKPVELKAFEI